MLDLPETLPRRSRLSVANLLEEAPAGAETLRFRVAEYLNALEQATQDNGMLDSEAAQILGQRVLELIDLCYPSAPHYVHAAVMYFVNSDDVEHDLDSLSGFDDDIEVFNAVCAHLGQESLQVLP